MSYIEIKYKPKLLKSEIVNELLDLLIFATSSFFSIEKESVIASCQVYPNKMSSKYDILIRAETSIWKKDKIDEWGKILLIEAQKTVDKINLKGYKMNIGVKTYVLESSWHSNT